jgi:dipeptidyl aminopeptidase/acylaminoacyl peptidase
VNYGGSTGYGRGWIRPQLGDWGGVDAADVHAALDHVIGLGLADPERLGVLGLSYGGFMALQALTVTPELFRCAIDVAGVEDWNDWYRDPGGPWIRDYARPGRAWTDERKRKRRAGYAKV